MPVEARRDARGRWINPEPLDGPRPEARQFFKWAFTERRRRVRENLARGERLPAPVPHAADALRAASEGLHAAWIGHTTFVLRVNGRTLLLDPVWGDRAGAYGVGPKRLTPPGIPWDALPTIDALLLSHNHYDHLDVPTLAKLPRETPVYCPVGVGPLLRGLGFTRVTERTWWQSADHDGARLTLVPAQHFSRRAWNDEDRTLWGGWVIEADGYRAYFAGDTGWMTRAFHDMAEKFPDLDAALLPIGAYEPRWFMSRVHMNPAEAGEAWLATRARALVPMHWGTFRLADEPMDAPPNEIAAWARDRRVDAQGIRMPRGLGDTIDLGAPR